MTLFQEATIKEYAGSLSVSEIAKKTGLSRFVVQKYIVDNRLPVFVQHQYCYRPQPNPFFFNVNARKDWAV